MPSTIHSTNFWKSLWSYFFRSQGYGVRKLLRYSRNAIEYKIWDALLRKTPDKHVSFLKDIFLKIEEIEQKSCIKLEDYDLLHNLASFWSNLPEHKKAKFRKGHNV
jgi:hypothetical protein